MRVFHNVSKRELMLIIDNYAKHPDDNVVIFNPGEEIVLANNIITRFVRRNAITIFDLAKRYKPELLPFVDKIITKELSSRVRIDDVIIIPRCVYNTFRNVYEIVYQITAHISKWKKVLEVIK